MRSDAHGPRRGNWRPGQISATFILVAEVGVIVTSFTRGADYLRQDSDTSSVLSRVQDSAPLPVWGAAFILAFAVVAIGMAGRWGTLVGAGHLLAGALYGGIAFGLFLETHLGPGVRTPVGLAVASLIHGAFGLGTFAALRQAEESEHPSGPT
jgi:hypothetical protein